MLSSESQPLDPRPFEPQPYDPRPCALGEGAFWHPERAQFFWFDILGRKLYARGEAGADEWDFPRIASAAARIDAHQLLLATEFGLAVFDLDTGALRDLVAVEADQPQTRSNDGRADRQGGFWFGTMGKSAEAGSGAIYRYYRGRIVQLFDQVSIPNAISFAPDGRLAYFADTALGLVWAQPLDAEGWPEGERRVFLDLTAEGLNPDGAVVDCEGGLWIAKWGASAVMRYTPEGQRSHSFTIGGKHASCPAFGGADLGDLLVTTAIEGISSPDAYQGRPYLLRPGFQGIAEPLVIV